MRIVWHFVIKNLLLEIRKEKHNLDERIEPTGIADVLQSAWNTKVTVSLLHIDRFILVSYLS